MNSVYRSTAMILLAGALLVAQVAISVVGINCDANHPSAVCFSRSDYGNPQVQRIMGMIASRRGCLDATRIGGLSVIRCCKGQATLGANGQPLSGGGIVYLDRRDVVPDSGTLFSASQACTYQQ
ncbi:hypothetical protein PGT21_011767 [Puccinia graminis f. sp. tritici]|uniref:Cyanovirin-N domain-containing protein n=2 Tax=Puccinia graminis f. sp. tritici TaxID=56615 RepID=E3JWF3_PUCGT|nr:uncharacterized protein PGTG_02819 [Puccinia graminis f. sp. tritici CRL 75-36-700-3]EFP76378.1 hypothetical protein PGTG_02819 [Puccinia graminis f. sp. tritici CRL 75-36-700-3]KAA1079445.1 hypothetical protein PGT21_011767 [Puccinia graminis f. sp. tritici]